LIFSYGINEGLDLQVQVPEPIQFAPKVFLLQILNSIRHIIENAKLILDLICTRPTSGEALVSSNFSPFDLKCGNWWGATQAQEC
jgi:hypothetical protein